MHCHPEDATSPTCALYVQIHEQHENTALRDGDNSVRKPPLMYHGIAKPYTAGSPLFRNTLSKLVRASSIIPLLLLRENIHEPVRHHDNCGHSAMQATHHTHPPISEGACPNSILARA